MTSDDQRLAEIKARVEAATEGPWTASLCEWGCACCDIKGRADDDCEPSTCGEGRILQGAFIPQTKTTEWGGGDYCDMNDADAEFCANAIDDIPWMSARIKALEAERDEVREEWDEAFNTTMAVFRERKDAWKIIPVLRKWARRWKRVAKREQERIADLKDEVDYYREAQKETLDIAMAERTRLFERIAALENAARSCATCMYFNPDYEPREYCLEHCRDEIIRHKGWVFDEARFAPKGGAGNGV